MDTDASQEAVGAVLSQVQDNLEHVLSYFSKGLSKTERDYCVTRKEILPVVMALKHFHLLHQECPNQEVIKEEGGDVGVEDMQIRVTARQQSGQCAPTDESFFPNQGWL